MRKGLFPWKVYTSACCCKGEFGVRAGLGAGSGVCGRHGRHCRPSAQQSGVRKYQVSANSSIADPLELDLLKLDPDSRVYGCHGRHCRPTAQQSGARKIRWSNS